MINMKTKILVLNILVLLALSETTFSQDNQSIWLPRSEFSQFSKETNNKFSLLRTDVDALKLKSSKEVPLPDWLYGSGAPGSATGTNNNFYLDIITGDVFVKKNNTWEKLMKLKGEKGDIGERGYAGLKGDKGDCEEFKRIKIYEGLISFLNTSNQSIAQIGATDTHDGYARFYEQDLSECVFIGAAEGGGGLVSIFNKNGEAKIQLSTRNYAPFDGYIWIKGTCCDYSETFEFKTRENVITGTVMSMDGKGGGLVPSEKAYDPKVVGVISGAGGLQTGMQIGSRKDGSNDLPVAVSGQVYIRICMENGPIEVGDLLVASSIPGVAMKASGIEKTTGTVVGKALEPYNELGKREGLVLMLVMMR
jgi:hypothetical protein